MFKKSILLATALGLATITGLSINPAEAGSGTQKEAVIAVEGYDLVSFFAAGNRPVAGDAKFAVRHDGKLYQFVSQANADAFKAAPAAYLPQYGGYCAWAAAEGNIAPGFPEFATVVKGKLYFNYSAEVMATWSKDIPGFITKADRNWPDIARQAG